MLLTYCRMACGQRLASEPEGPGSSPKTTDFLTNSCEQATNALVSLFTKQCKLVQPASWRGLAGGETLCAVSLMRASRRRKDVCNLEICLEIKSLYWGLTPWKFNPTCSVCHSLFISYPSSSTRSFAQLVII